MNHLTHIDKRRHELHRCKGMPAIDKKRRQLQKDKKVRERAEKLEKRVEKLTDRIGNTANIQTNNTTI